MPPPPTGSAVLAAYGAKHFSSIDEGKSAMVQPGRMVEPIDGNVKKYEKICARYLALYPALKEVLSKQGPGGGEANRAGEG